MTDWLAGCVSTNPAHCQLIFIISSADTVWKLVTSIVAVVCSVGASTGSWVGAGVGPGVQADKTSNPIKVKIRNHCFIIFWLSLLKDSMLVLDSHPREP